MIRGEIWWADYGLPQGSEPGFRRPVLIVQNDIFNQSRINTTLVIPLTTNPRLGEVPGNIYLGKKESKLNRDGVLIVSQVGVIDRSRLTEKVSKLNKEIMEKIDASLLFLLGIKSPV